MRRGRLASLTILFISLFNILVLVAALLERNVGQACTMAIALLCNLFALFVFNRRGYFVAAGSLIVLVLDGSFALSLLGQPLAWITGSAFDVIVIALLVIVVFFPPRTVFVVMTVNILFIVLWTYFGPHTAETTQFLQHNLYTFFFPHLSLEFFVAVIICLWMNSALKVIAELEGSVLEQRAIEQQEEQLALKQQLEDGIQQILQTHVRAANGDFSARAPLNKENVLWQVAHSLNNLLSRLERFEELQDEMKQTHDAARVLVKAMRAAKANKQPFQPPRTTGTVIDQLIVELAVVGAPFGGSEKFVDTGKQAALPIDGKRRLAETGKHPALPIDSIQKFANTAKQIAYPKQKNTEG